MKNLVIVSGAFDIDSTTSQVEGSDEDEDEDDVIDDMVNSEDYVSEDEGPDFFAIVRTNIRVGLEQREIFLVRA
jgi:hypothetical protein